jgi:DNA-binding CsgD family transcriptional regulator
VRAEIAFSRCEFDEAEQMSMRAFNDAGRHKQYHIAMRALYYVARIGLHKGSYETVQDALGQMELIKSAMRPNACQYDCATGFIYSVLGMVDNVPAWLKSDFSFSVAPRLLRGFENIARVRYWLAVKDYHQLLAFLDARIKGHDDGFLFGSISARALMAVALYRTGQRERAFALLNEAYELSAPNDIKLPFVDLANDMRTLTAAAQKAVARGETKLPPLAWLKEINRRSATYARKLTFVARKFNEREGKGPKVRLTQREQKILNGLGHGMSRSEIAADFGISQNTVKAAIRIIYDKLGAQTLGDAVRIGERYGILD